MKWVSRLLARFPNLATGPKYFLNLHYDKTKKLTIPARRPIKPVYIRQLVQIIENLEEDES